MSQTPQLTVATESSTQQQQNILTDLNNELASLTDDVAAQEAVNDSQSEDITTLLADSIPILTTAAAVQSALDADNVVGKQLAIGNVRIPVTSTIEMVGGSGGSIFGASATRAGSSTDVRVCSAFVASTGLQGNANVPMFRMERSDCDVKRIGFHGGTSAQVASGTRGDLAIEFNRATGDHSGTGTGKYRFERCTWSGWRKCIQSASDTEEFNCDELEFQYCDFDRCTNVLEMNSVQSLGFTFHKCRFVQLAGAVIAAKNGGAVTISKSLMPHPGTIFSFPQGAASGGSPNAAYFDIDWLKLDAQASGGKIIDMYPIASNGYYLTSHCHRVIFPPLAASYWGGGSDQNNITPAFKITGNFHLTISYPYNLQRGMIAWDCGGSSAVTIEIVSPTLYYGGVQATITEASEVLNLAQSRGTARVKITNMRNLVSRTPYADVDAEFTGLL